MPEFDRRVRLCFLIACSLITITACSSGARSDTDADVASDVGLDSDSGDGADGDADADGDAVPDGDAEPDGDSGQGWPARFDPLVEALLDDLERNEAYGVSVAVMEDGVVTFAEAFGSRDADGDEPLTPQTLMQIGSTTKHMTAAALLQKVEQGLVSLDDTLESVLPDLELAQDPSWDDQLTLRMLLSQQSGLNDMVPWGSSSADSELAARTYGSWAEQAYLMNPPGAFWNYSNPNFVLAGLVTEHLDDRFWPDLIREDIFGPVGMNRTYLRLAEVEADGDHAVSYGMGFDELLTGNLGPVDLDQMPDPAWVRPAGMVWTTPTQMMAWADFVMHGDTEVLSDDLREQISEPHIDTLSPGEPTHYGFGLFVHQGYRTHDDQWYEMPLWEHGGNTLSFSNILYMLPEQDFAFCITSSGVGTDFSPSVEAAITTLVDLPEPTAAQELEIDPARFDDHVGAYIDEWNVGDVVITREGDTLQIEMPTLEAYGYEVGTSLIAVTSEVFYVIIDGAPVDLTFIAIEEGGSSHYLRNRSFVAGRVPADKDMEEATRRPSPEDVTRWLARARRSDLAENRCL